MEAKLAEASGRYIPSVMLRTTTYSLLSHSGDDAFSTTGRNGSPESDQHDSTDGCDSVEKIKPHSEQTGDTVLQRYLDDYNQSERLMWMLSDSPHRNSGEWEAVSDCAVDSGVDLSNSGDCQDGVRYDASANACHTCTDEDDKDDFDSSDGDNNYNVNDQDNDDGT